jgi:hypothetical protein
MKLRTAATKTWSLLCVMLLAITMLTQAAAQTASAATSTLPCDVFASGGQSCVAAYSTVRALSASYGGPLYQVTRQSDGTSTDIGLLSTGGYVNAAAQDGFCVNTVCTITRIYDQSGNHSDLGLGPAGSSGSANIPARADALPVTVAGHEAYGVRITAKVGYRYVPSTANAPAKGMAVNGQPESMYEVASGTDATDHCCFDFGNMETSATDTGNGHMDAIIISTWCGVGPCSGNGPWIQADLENGVYMGNGSSANPSNVSENSKFITAVLRNDGQSQFALDGGDATRSTLTSLYSGSLPSGGYAPMHQEGGIGLGVGGDQSDMAPGAFFEGAIVSGYASNSTVASVQSNIAAAAYSGTSGGGPGVPVTGPGGSCLDVSGNDNGGNGTPVDIWTCQHDAVDQSWQYLRTTPDQGLPSGAAIPSWQNPEELVTMGRCLDVDGNVTTPGAKVELWTCNGVGGQKWVPQSNGTLLNPQSGLCLTSPGGSTSNGTVLDIETCSGSSGQRFVISPGWLIQGQTISAPAGKCVGSTSGAAAVAGTAVDIASCAREAADQYWWQNGDGSITALNMCLDVDGNVTTPGTKVELWTCNGVGGQKWVQQTDGTLLNPQSGLCLTDPGGSTSGGTVLDIEACSAASDQQFYVNSGHPISAPGGKCVDVPGDDLYGAIGPQLQLWDCQATAVDQHWTYDEPSQSLQSLGKCLDIDGDSTASGAHVELWACNGIGGQRWVQQPDGSLLNPQSGLCLTDPGGNTANGTQLDIEACTGGAAQQFNYQTAVALAPGMEISFRATTACCTGDFIRHQNGRAILSPITVTSSTLDKQDATWIVRRGLANSSCLSFESKDYPNGYLRQTSGAVYQQQNDGTQQFASDATFCAVPGKNGQGESLSWNATPADYLRHYNGELYVASDGGADAWDSATSWTDDVSWLPRPAWAP